MKTFYGRRDGGGCGIWVGDERRVNGDAPDNWPGRGGLETPERKLPARPELFKGQAVPFDWGTEGPGTAHAAAALLVFLLDGGGVGNPPAPAIRAAYPIFRRFLAALPAEDFELSETFLTAFLRAACESQPAPANGSRQPL